MTTLRGESRIFAGPSKRGRHRRINQGFLPAWVATAKIVPAAMIFVPCKDGISHNEREEAKPEDLAAGASLLLEAVLEAAEAKG